jgi:sugar/nucleoside kinase (ribokinase family)
MADFDFVLVGDLNIDLVLSGMQRLPSTGTEELAREIDFRLGGSVGNCACALASLGARVAFQTLVGQDAFGDFLIEAVRRRGVHTDWVRRSEEVKTGVTVSLSCPEDRGLATYLGCIGALSEEHLDWSLLERAGHLHAGSIFLLRGMRGHWAELFRRAKEKGLTTSLDLGWDPAQEWDGELAELLELVDVLLPNEEEVTRIARQSSVEQAARELAGACKPAGSQAGKLVVVKMGEKGSGAWQGDRVWRAAAFKVEPEDTTALGDCFNAGFLVAWKEGKQIAECLRMGNASAAVAASRLGEGRYAKQQEVEEMVGR